MDRHLLEQGLPGAAVRYVPETFTTQEAWDRLSPTLREWAMARAGGHVEDPHAHVPTRYLYCQLDPMAEGAAYWLVLFGASGLVACDGTTDVFTGDSGSRWRHNRYSVPFDLRSLRGDHHVVGAPSRSSTEGVRAEGLVVGLLDDHHATMLGNLPVRTQHFLLSGFLSSPQAPISAVLPRISTSGSDYVETYVGYLFTPQRLAFAHARRMTPYRGCTSMETFDRSAERAALDATSWTVVAWAGPVMKPR